MATTLPEISVAGLPFTSCKANSAPASALPLFVLSTSSAAVFSTVIEPMVAVTAIFRRAVRAMGLSAKAVVVAALLVAVERSRLLPSSSSDVVVTKSS